MRAFDGRGFPIHWREDGPADGRAVVFSNSLGTDLRVWDPLLPFLPKDLRLIRYDKSGHGLSGFAGERSIDEHAEDVAALMAHVGVQEAVIVGLSVGGLIAQALAARHPDRVEALVLCDTGHKIGTPEIWNPRFEAIEAGGMEAVADPTMERWFSKDFQDDPRIGLWRAMLTRTPAEGYCAVGRAIRDADYTQSTQAIDKPALCVVGDEDGATPPALVRELAGLLKDAECQVVAGCGHLPCVERPEVLGELMTGFLERTA